MSSVSIARLPNAICLVRLEGDFDMVNVPEVVEALDEAIADPQARILAVDLSAVAFLDSTMLQTLVSARDRAQQSQKPVWLVRPAPLAWRVFTVTLLNELFRDFGSLAELEDYAARTVTALRA